MSREVNITLTSGHGFAWQNAKQAEEVGGGRAIIVHPSARVNPRKAKAVVERTCGCGVVFSVALSRLRRGRGRFCSAPCAARHNARKLHASRSQVGERNPNWRGGRAARPYASYVKRFKVANPEKARAHDAVHRAIVSGALVRPDACSACGVSCRPDAHHEDYTAPLRVEWLCRRCHRKADARRRGRGVSA